MKRCLLLVDAQNDFISGSLPVPGAKNAMESLAAWLLEKPERYALKLATCDFHPWNHCSFSDNGGQWPRHCVAHSEGAAIWHGLFPALFCGSGATVALTKGTSANQEEYSVFQNADARDRIMAELESAKIDAIDICGIAGDICVLNTLNDGISLLGRDKFSALLNFSPSLDGGAKLADFCSRESICVR